MDVQIASSNPTLAATPAHATHTVTVPTGRKALSGGWKLADEELVTVQYAYPVSSTQWEFRSKNGTGASYTGLTLYVAHVPELDTVEVVTTEPGTEDVLRVKS